MKTKDKIVFTPEIQKFQLSDLVTPKYDLREITDEAFSGLSNSIEKFGCVEPIVINVHAGLNKIVSGRQRFRVLRSMGIKECLCVIVDLNDTDEQLLYITLNNREIQGQFVEELGEYINWLKNQLIDDSEIIDLKISQLQGELEAAGVDVKQDEVPESPKSIVKAGDLWDLGGHKLLCGDSTDPKTVGKLFNWGQADMVFTDPPYNMNYQSKKPGDIQI